MAGRQKPSEIVPKVVYVDTCIFLSWLTDDKQRSKEEMKGIENLFNQADQEMIHICISTIVFTEVLQSKIETNQYQLFERVLNRRNVTIAAVNMRIAKLAGELRSHSSIHKKPDEDTLGIADAIHLATAIDAECKTFYTFDGSDGKSRKGKEVRLIPLSGTIAVRYYLEIKAPSTANSLFDDVF